MSKNQKLSIFNFDSYREFIKAWIDHNKSRRGLLTEMCKAMSCHNAHLSRALSEKIHLTMDQVYKLSLYLKLSSTESQYFLKLAELNRASDQGYVKKLKDDLAAIKKNEENLSNIFKESRLQHIEQEMLYYSSWHWVALHYITEIEKYRTPEAIARRLELPLSFVEASLKTLESFGLVRYSGGQWLNISRSIHLPKTSPMNSVQHSNLRQRAALKSQILEDGGIHFSAVQTLSKKDYEKIKNLLLEVIQSYREIANPSKPEEIIGFNLDFYKI